MFRRPKTNEIRIPPHSINSDADSNTSYRFSISSSSAIFDYLDSYLSDDYEIENAADSLLIKITSLISKMLFYIADKWCDFDIWVERQIVAKNRKKKKKAKTNHNPRKIKDILSSLNLLKFAKRNKPQSITEFVEHLYDGEDDKDDK